MARSPDLTVEFLAPKWLTRRSFPVFCRLSSLKAASELLPPCRWKPCHPGWPPHSFERRAFLAASKKPQTRDNIDCVFSGWKTPVGDSTGSAMSLSPRLGMTLWLGLGLSTMLLHPSWFSALELRRTLYLSHGAAWLSPCRWCSSP